MKRSLLLVSLFGAFLLGASPCDSADDASDPSSEGQGGQVNGADGGTQGSGTQGGDANGTAGSSGSGGGDSDSGGGGSGDGSSGGHDAGPADDGSSVVVDGGAGEPSGGDADGGAADACDLDCGADQHCELVQVQCIQAPCPPLPMCVDGAPTAGCGSRGLDACAAGEYCAYPASADCGRADAPGSCQAKPEICTAIYAPVCGCDGKTYASACNAAGVGVSVDYEGECQ